MIQFIIRDKTSFATFCWILWPSSKLKQIIDSQKGKKLSVYSNATSRAKVAKNQKIREKQDESLFHFSDQKCRHRPDGSADRPDLIMPIPQVQKMEQ